VRARPASRGLRGRRLRERTNTRPSAGRRQRLHEELLPRSVGRWCGGALRIVRRLGEVSRGALVSNRRQAWIRSRLAWREEAKHVMIGPRLLLRSR
jgi:hypothetical protein